MPRGELPFLRRAAASLVAPPFFLAVQVVVVEGSVLPVGPLVPVAVESSSVQEGVFVGPPSSPALFVLP